jgi:hypothetical protein
MAEQLTKKQILKRRVGAGSLFKKEESLRFSTTQEIQLIFCTKG